MKLISRQLTSNSNIILRSDETFSLSRSESSAACRASRVAAGREILFEELSAEPLGCQIAEWESHLGVQKNHNLEFSPCSVNKSLVRTKKMKKTNLAKQRIAYSNLEKSGLWRLSFADPDKHLGVAIVRGKRVPRCYQERTGIRH